MGKKARVSKFIDTLGQLAKEMPDKRSGRHNQLYTMADAVRGAFSIFHMQSGSFLAHQRSMSQKRGQCNLKSVFKLKQIPSDTQIRNMMDGVPAAHLEGAYESLWKQLSEENQLTKFHILGERLLVGLDGIQFFSSNKIQCEQCSWQETEVGKRYHHRALTALVVHRYAS